MISPGAFGVAHGGEPLRCRVSTPSASEGIELNMFTSSSSYDPLASARGTNRLSYDRTRGRPLPYCSKFDR